MLIKRDGQKGNDEEVAVALWDKMYAESCRALDPDDQGYFISGWKRANATARLQLIRLWRRRVTRSWMAFSMETLAKAIPSLGTTGTIKLDQVRKVALSQQRKLAGTLPCVRARVGQSLSMGQPKPLPPRCYTFDWKYSWTPAGKEIYQKWHARRRGTLSKAGSEVA